MDSDHDHLSDCIALAREALEAGDAPFGSVLVGGDGRVLRRARNHAVTGDPTRHPEFELARWAAMTLDPEARAAATVYTSGEHCPMCAAAHAWAGLGPIVYASSSEQLAGWLAEMGADPLPVQPLPIARIAPGIRVRGPVVGLDEEVRALHLRFHAATAAGSAGPA